MEPNLYLLRYGELALKGRNRDFFVKDLMATIKPRVAPLGGKIIKQHKRLMLRCEAPAVQVKAALSTVFGITGISPIWQTEKTFEAITERCWALLEPFRHDQKSFAVRVRRADKRFPITSVDLQRKIAENLYERGLRLKIDLSHPDLNLGVSVRFDQTEIFMETWPGLGGLPISPKSRHGLLLSGGIDSPVAGHLIQKRGGLISAVYFHTPPFTVEEAREKVVDLASALARYQNRLILFVVNFSEVMKTIRAECSAAYNVVLSRRFMMRVACRLLAYVEGRSIITGESLGQVASQTVENIAAIGGVSELPVLRPLIGMDKLEIIAIAKRIGTFETSIRPFQDCCSLFSPKEPVTKANPRIVALEEAKLDIEGLVSAALERTERFSIRPDFSQPDSSEPSSTRPDLSQD